MSLADSDAKSAKTRMGSEEDTELCCCAQWSRKEPEMYITCTQAWHMIWLDEDLHHAGSSICRH